MIPVSKNMRDTLKVDRLNLPTVRFALPNSGFCHL